MTRDTIQNAREITKAIVIEYGVTIAFKNAMRNDTEDVRIGFFGKKITDEMILFIFASQFKSMSFPFIFHRGTRPNPAEEAARQNLRLHLKYVAAALAYMTYHCRIQIRHYRAP